MLISAPEKNTPAGLVPDNYSSPPPPTTTITINHQEQKAEEGRQMRSLHCTALQPRSQKI
jgi:hypothetical protein